MEDQLYRNKPLWRKLAFILLLFFLYFLPQFVLEPFLKMGLAANLLVSLLISGIILVILFVVYRLAASKGLIGPIDKQIFSGKNLAYVGIGFFSIYAINILITLISGLDNTQNQAALEGIFTKVQPFTMFLLVVVLAAVCEEIIFRGAITQLFTGTSLIQRVLAFLVPTVLFGLSHGPTDIPSFLIYTLMGAVLATVALKSGRIEVSILLHFLNNAISYLAMTTLQ